MFEACANLMQGRQDPAALMSLFSAGSHEFWKGAAIGIALVLLLGNGGAQTLKDLVTGLFDRQDAETD